MKLCLSGLLNTQHITCWFVGFSLFASGSAALATDVERYIPKALWETDYPPAPAPVFTLPDELPASASIVAEMIEPLDEPDVTDQQGTFSLIIENDVLSRTDRHYTSGIQLGYFQHPDQTPKFAQGLANRLPFLTGPAQAGWFIGHEIYTPESLDVARPLPNQRPYAAWAYLGMSLSTAAIDGTSTWRLQLGLVGPSAQGEKIQNSIHRIIDNNDARGWDNQLNDEPGLVLAYERTWRLTPWQHDKVDLLPQTIVSVGNISTYASSGLTVRYGSGLNQDYGAGRIRPAITGSPFFNTSSSQSLYVFAGASLRLVAYNLFLDGNTYQDSLSVNRRVAVWDGQAGVVYTRGRWRLSYTFIIRSKEFTQQEEADRFGSFGISFNF